MLLLDLLPQTSLVSSKREARQFLESGAVAVNGEKAALDTRLASKDLLHGKGVLLKRGKKKLAPHALGMICLWREPVRTPTDLESSGGKTAWGEYH